MLKPIPPSVEKLYNALSLHLFVLLSLLLQIILILLAPFRKRTRNMVVTGLIWSAYTLSDWAANFAMGLMTDNINNNNGNNGNINVDFQLLAFWAPFLLAHLGGADNITAFALEDNELWPRYVSSFIFQVLSAGYMFLLSLPHNKLWIPTTLIFIAGVAKCWDRTRALYLACMDTIRDSFVRKQDFELIAFQLLTFTGGRQARDSATQNEKLNYSQVVLHAYNFFETFKGLLADVIISLVQGWKSHEFFLQRNASDALRVLESELNFIYELFHTKASVAHKNKIGYFSRFFSLALFVSSLVYFFVQDKESFHKSDIAITYTLLIGSICLESIAILMLILSDWTLISLLQGSTTDLHPKRSFIANKLCEFLSLMNSKDHNFHPPLFSSRTLFRRWSESVLGYNLIDYSIKEGLRINIRESRKEKNKFVYFVSLYWSFVVDKLISGLRLQGFVDGRNVTICSFTTEHPAWNIIFQELKTKSNEWEHFEAGKNKIRECRGDWVLKEHPDSLYRKLEPFVVDYPFDQSILLWHIATELHFTIDKEPEDEKTKQYRDCSKLISDYMSYLVVMQPQMISSVAGMAKLSFQDTCAGAVRCLSKWRFNRGEETGSKRKIEKKEACKKILQDSEVNPLILTLFGKFGEDHEQMGDNHNIELTGETKSVLLDACSLAKELEGLNDGDRWEIMCKVWVEMLSYAAVHCRATLHFQQLSKGGELITFVWLLITHFGSGEMYVNTAGLLNITKLG